MGGVIEASACYWVLVPIDTYGHIKVSHLVAVVLVRILGRLLLAGLLRRGHLGSKLPFLMGRKLEIC